MTNDQYRALLAHIRIVIGLLVFLVILQFLGLIAAVGLNIGGDLFKKRNARWWSYGGLDPSETRGFRPATVMVRLLTDQAARLDGAKAIPTNQDGLKQLLSCSRKSTVAVDQPRERDHAWTPYASVGDGRYNS
jgi:hypothetical protein